LCKHSTLITVYTHLCWNTQHDSLLSITKSRVHRPHSKTSDRNRRCSESLMFQVPPNDTSSLPPSEYPQKAECHLNVQSWCIWYDVMWHWAHSLTRHTFPSLRVPGS
jgi:hypothetical protein